MHRELSSGVYERGYCLIAGGGVDDNLLIVTCIPSRVSCETLLESLDCVFSIVEVSCGIPDLIVFC